MIMLPCLIEKKVSRVLFYIYIDHNFTTDAILLDRIICRK